MSLSYASNVFLDIRISGIRISTASTDQEIDIFFGVTDSASKYKKNYISPSSILPLRQDFGHSAKIDKFSKGRAYQEINFTKLSNGVFSTNESIDFSFAPKIKPTNETIYVGMGEQSAIGDNHHVYRLRDFVVAQGIYPPNLSSQNHTIINRNKQVWSSGVYGTLFGSGKIYNLTQIAMVNGFVATVFGIINVSPRFVYPSGINAGGYGKPVIYNGTQYAIPIGIGADYQAGKPSVTNTRRYFPITGFDASQVAEPTIWFYKRNVGVGAGDIGKVGEPFVMGGVRFIYPKGISHQVMYRYDYPNPNQPTYGIAYDEYSYPVDPNSTIDYLPYYSVVSYGLFGTQNVINRNLWIKPQGFSALGLAKPYIAHDVQYINPQGFDNLKLGYIADYTPPDNEGKGEKRPYAWENPSYAMRGYWNSDTWQPSGLTIYNGKRPISPIGIAHIWRDINGREQSYFSNPYIAYRIQTIKPSGFDSLQVNKPTLNYKQNIYLYGIYGTLFGAGTEAINTKLFVIRPNSISDSVVERPSVSPRFIIASGFVASLVSLPKVTGGLFQGFDGLEFGHHAIGYFIQHVNVNGIDSLIFGGNDIRYHISLVYPASAIRDSGVFGDIKIINRTRYVAPFGIEPYAISQWTVIYLGTQQAWAVGIGEVPISLPTIYNLTQIVYPYGYDSQAFGRAMVADYIRYLYQVGNRTDVYGNANVWKTPKAETTGKDTSVFGQPWISNRNRYIKTGNIYPPVIQVSPNATIEYRNKYITVAGFDANSYGVIRVEDFLRYLEPLGKDNLLIGAAWVSDSPRLIAPIGIKAEDIRPHYVSRNIIIEPKGFDATGWLTRIIPDIQTIYHQSNEGVVFGETLVMNNRQFIGVKGFASWDEEKYRYSIARVFNSRQYITQSDKEDERLNESVFGQWTAIENNNKTLVAFGINSKKFGYVRIKNNAVLILVKGNNELNVALPMIAYRLRYIKADGIEPVSIGQWSVIYNNARVTYPHAIDSQAFGDAGIKNTRRYYERVGNWDSQELGVPMIAYRVRNIDIESRYGIAPPYIALPKVENLTHYVEVQGFSSDSKWLSAVGVPHLSIHWNIIAPRWSAKDFFGEPFIWNKTPELKIFGHDIAEFGTQSLRTQWREVVAVGDNANLFGLAKISDTKQTVQIVGGIGMPPISQYHRLTKGVSPPYALQYILHNEPESGFDSLKFGMAGLNQNVLYADGFLAQKFGDAFVWSNNLLIKYGIAQQQEVSTPSIRNKNNYIFVQGINNEIKVSEPKVKLQTIYQAHTWDDKLVGGWFGWATVENQHRTYLAYGRDMLSMGDNVSIDLRTRQILPKGIKPPYFGIPMIPFVPQNVEVKGFYESLFGISNVHYPPYTGKQTIKSYGLDGITFGYGRIELKNRAVAAIGFDALKMGARKYDDNPYMWQGLRVGERVPFQLGGFDSSIFGDSMISLKIRGILVDGFDALIMDYESKYFSKRMRVILEDEINLDKSISVAGINDSAIGIHAVKHRQYFIRPDGNSETFRKGAGVV